MTESVTEKVAAAEASFKSDLARVQASPAPKAVEDLRLKYLGRKGLATHLVESLRDVSKEERPVAGKAVNTLRQSIEAAINGLKDATRAFAIRAKLEAPACDVSLPATEPMALGSLHPVTLMRQTLRHEFTRLGFSEYDGPEIDFDFYNFTALNLPENHPARDMQDTFYLQGKDKLLLRTHTSNIQIHCMMNEAPPLRYIAMGRVFRCDSDITHTPMFHQIEGFVVDKNITMAHLRGLIDTVFKNIFGQDLKTRFRPSFFPFTEPSAEMDLQCVSCRGKGCHICKHTGWLEVGGCGMIHPSVFESVGYNSDEYTGFAFGFGIDRMAMLKNNLPDLRTLFEGSKAFLGQFPSMPTP